MLYFFLLLFGSPFLGLLLASQVESKHAFLSTAEPLTPSQEGTEGDVDGCCSGLGLSLSFLCGDAAVGFDGRAGLGWESPLGLSL